MLKKQNIRISGRKKFKLQNTLDKVVRDSVIKSGIKSAEKVVYRVGNKMDKLVELAQKNWNRY